MLKKSTLSLFLVLFYTQLALAGLFFREAPRNTFEKKGPETQEAQALKNRFHNNQASLYSQENLRTLSDQDFIQINKLSQNSLKQAIELIRSGKLVVVDSVVGNATRLGNPPGGKGAVVIGDNITFLDAKIIRLAVDSHWAGAPIKQILWTSDENKEAVTHLLESFDSRLENMNLNLELKKIVRKYLKGKNTILMAQSTLLPVIDNLGELSEERYRNLGAGEMIPTIFRSGADKLVNLKKDSVLIFSNIDFDLSYPHVLAASLEAGRPDLMQVHIKTQASGGSAYWVNENNHWRIVPLEGIEVPKEVLDKATTLNSNTVVMQGNALNPAFYDNLPIPFEEKIYDGKTFYLPKLSLSDIGKHPEIKSAIAIGNTEEYFFTGSKNTKLLLQTGPQEISHRIQRWSERASYARPKIIMCSSALN